MDLVNRSGLPLEVTTALDKSGREHLVVIAKATYRFSDDGGPPVLDGVPRPVIFTDVFTGEPGDSAPIYEADTALRKQRCDVILDATAHAPGGRAVAELDASVRVGSITKQMLVVGDRAWKKGVFGASATKPKPFTSMPLHYGRAFGGAPKSRANGMFDVYLQNPVGVGYCPDARADAVEDMPLPNIEDHVARITAPNANVKPMALGPIGRHWDPRRVLAGTYDARWREETFPLLPDDFDEAFMQCAPADQQIDFPQGGEAVVLHNLVAERPIVTFELPKPELVIKILTTSHHAEELAPVVDTLFIEPDARIFTMVYRASIPLDRKGVLALKILAAGAVCKKWWESKVFGTEDCGCGGDDSKDPGAITVGGPDDPAWQDIESGAEEQPS